VRGAACIAHFNKEDSSKTSRRIEEKSRRTIDRCPLRLNSLETEGGTKCIDGIQITTIELQTDFHKICWETRRQFDGIFTRSAAAPMRGGRRGAGRWSRRSRSPEQEEHSSRRSRDKSTCPVGRAPPPCCCFPAECTPPRGLDAPLPPSRSRTSTSPPKILESREPYIFKTCLQAMAEGRF
jgi:hypothetical protein